MQEIWKDIKDYEKLYQVSNLGEIKGIKRNKILKLSKDKYGYLKVCLCKNNKKKIYFVHRLVALAFLGKSDLTINHIDKNKINNNIDNLEYMTIKENNRYSKCKKILQFDMNNNFIKEWLGAMEAEELLKIPNSNITNCCKHKRKSAGGYKWSYANDR